MEEIRELLVSLLVMAVTGGISILGVYLRKVLKQLEIKAMAEIVKIEDEKKKMLIAGAFEDLADLVSKNVALTEQTLVKEIKAGAVDGKLTKEDAIKVANKVEADVLGQLKDDSKAVLEENLVDLNAYVQGMIEEIILGMK